MSLLDDILKKLGAEARNSVNSGIRKAKSDINKGIDNAVKKAQQNASMKHKSIRFEKLPQTAEEMLAMPNYDQKNEYAVAAFTVTALLRYAVSPEDGKAMLDVLNGPENPANIDIQLMDERLIGGEYLARSYFKGAVPKNDYTPDQPYTVEIIEYSNSRDIENYLYLYIPSGGADNPRQLQLRKKPSTGEWFVWVYKGLLLDIRIPTSEDKWA